ncbi:MAG: hypothetical protein QW548_03075 [Candidatus Aenigmatarchaeota archaeon]
MIGLLLILLACYIGVLAARGLTCLTLLERSLIGIIAGFLIAAWSPFLIYIAVWDLGIACSAALAALAVIAAVATRRFGIRRKDFEQAFGLVRKSLMRNRLLLMFFVTLAIFFTLIFSSHMAEPRPDGIYTGANGAYGDIPFHMTLINHFQYGSGTLEYPIYAGARLTYPFIFDFFTAALSGPGMLGLRGAMMASSLMLVMLLVLSIYALALRFSQSKRAAMLAVALVLIGGGFGFVHYIGDAAQSGNLAVTKDYGHYTEVGIHWSNVIVQYLIPQRTLLLGFPAGIAILLLLFAGFDQRRATNGAKRHLAPAGFIMGALPLVHTHVFFAIGIVSAMCAAAYASRAWLRFFLPAFLLAFPQVMWILPRAAGEGFMRIQLGWLSRASGMADFAHFWLLNAGMLLVLGLAWFVAERESHKLQKAFMLSFWLIFIMSNIVAFQPNDYDNMKIMLLWWLGISIASATLIARMLEKGAPWKILAACLVAFSVLTGALSVYHEYCQHHRIFSAEDIEFAEWLKANTPHDAVFLTSDMHNHPVPALAGRTVVLGYGGWIWSHGLALSNRSADVKEMLAGGARAMELLENYGVDYVAIGWHERRKGANETYFAENFNLVYNTSTYMVFDVSGAPS